MIPISIRNDLETSQELFACFEGLLVSQLARCLKISCNQTARLSVVLSGMKGWWQTLR